jgi:FtsP/CotA-like multicopper oxidase with cupredoxin domain
MNGKVDRRQFLRGAATTAGGVLLAAHLPAWAQPISQGVVKSPAIVSGQDISLVIDRTTLVVDGKGTSAIGVNGTVPAPLIRLREGQKVRLAVTNNLDEDSSIHWHGLLVPPQMDGVPGVSFPGIKPRSTFVYEFPVIQSGTYWYHSHSGMQEQEGLYGPIVIDPAEQDPVEFDREHVIVLADHSAMHGATIFRKLKQSAGYFNHQRQTLSGLLAGRDQTLRDRLEWGQMRMDPTDISDVTGSTYTYVVNGFGPSDNWTALFKPGERVRLRFINAAAQTNFNVRIPDLPLTMVQADGQNIRPVITDEFQIAVAETFDVIVTPADRAYSIVAEAIDRSGLARATLAPREGMTASVPPLRPRPLTTMKDMGMGDMGGMDMGNPASKRGVDPSAEQNASRALASKTGWDASNASVAQSPSMSGMRMDNMANSPMQQGAMEGMDHSQMSHGSMGGMDHASMEGMSAESMSSMHAANDKMTMQDMGTMSMRDPKNAPRVTMGPGVQTIAPMPVDRTSDRPQGLEDVEHRVLVYRDLVSLTRNADVRAPSRSLDIHLTGNMERFMWSFDGVKLSEPAEPIPFRKDERVRIVLINDTMMPHPIHLHGHFFELVTGHGDHGPRKHTVNVAPGGKVTFDLTADAPGDWAFHCHNLYHMTAGMMRVVTVRPFDAEGLHAGA